MSDRVRPPAPTADPDTAFYWDGAMAGELRLQRCATCGEIRHPPGPMCPACRSLEFDVVRAGGTGTVFSSFVARYPELPGFDYPYVVAVVELAEGVRVIGNVRDAGTSVAIGDEVELFFEDHGDFRLPQFRPASRG